MSEKELVVLMDGRWAATHKFIGSGKGLVRCLI